MSEFKSIIDADFSGESMTFLQLVQKYCIVIPVIQRDYAQGRKTEKATEVRKDFVRDLISYIKEKNTTHELDFIYGTVNASSSSIEEFIPLDGQQRLTTLFLLHLYVAGRNGKFNEFISTMKNGDKYRFSYKTRNSSTMFCERLLSSFQVTILDEENTEKKKETNVFELLKDKESVEVEVRKPSKSIISNVIQNQGWFYKSWLNDPTVAGMLVMLEEIDRQFLNDVDDNLMLNAYDRLFGENDTPPITFQLLPLNGYSRTDDLYIKLNARGLYLSDFENFKARIEELMEDDSMACKDSFKQKIDIEWNEYLWKYRCGADNTDRIMENLFRNFIAFAYQPVETRTIGETMEYLLEQNKKTMRFTFSRYCELGVFHKRKEPVEPSRKDNERKMMEKVIAFFDVFCNDQTTPDKAQCDWLRAENFIHNCMIDKTASYSNRLRLYAYLQYYNVHKGSVIDSADLNQWMRLIRNLDDATDIDTAEQFYKAIRNIDDMLSVIDTKGVQEWLSSDARKYKITFFRQRQMKEECIKAWLVTKEKEWDLDVIQKAIKQGDDDDYLTGQMGFALDFAGAYLYYDTQENHTLTQYEIKEIGKKIDEYTNKTIELTKILRSNNPGKIVDEKLLERALLTLGMYLRPNSAKRWNFCNRPNDPYNSWKTLLFVEEENAYCRNIFKKMLDEITLGNIEAGLNDIIAKPKTSIPKWRKMLIDNMALIEYCTQGFLYIEDGSKLEDDDLDVILFSQSQMNHYHSELHTRDLYEKEKNNLQIGYHPERKYEVDSTIYIRFIKNGSDEKYEFRLCHWDGKWEYKFYEDVGREIPFSISISNSADGASILKDVFFFIQTNGYTIIQ